MKIQLANASGTAKRHNANARYLIGYMNDMIRSQIQKHRIAVICPATLTEHTFLQVEVVIGGIQIQRREWFCSSERIFPLNKKRAHANLAHGCRNTQSIKRGTHERTQTYTPKAFRQIRQTEILTPAKCFISYLKHAFWQVNTTQRTMSFACVRGNHPRSQSNTVV